MRVLRILCALLFALPFLIFTAHAADSSAPVVKVASGQLRGAATGELMIFKGIPYAAPPAGKLRWRPPQAAASWTGVRDASNYGHDCMQLPAPRDAAPLRTEPSEDCLYLNVWTPKKRSARPLPVIVWVYGGGFVNGGSSPAPYDGSHFAEKGLVFVSFNYRLGRFGFFAFPALDNEDGPVGNYAFMDQIEALRWVKRNIAAFGGNPNEVTIFGESAGGASVNALLTSPMARGLFQRAMIESGGGRDTVLPPAPLNHAGPDGQLSAEQAGINFARSMGIQGTDAAALAQLRDLPAEKVVNGMNMTTMAGQRETYSGAMIDGKVLEESPEDAFKAGKQAAVPVIVGANTADLGRSTAKTMADVFAPFGSDAEQAKSAFDVAPSETVAQIGTRVAAARMMIEPARFVARSFAKIGQPAYEYRFSYVATPLRARLSGAPHSSEIPYVFDTIQVSTWGDMGKGLTADDLRIANQANSYWANFAKTGDPNGPGLPKWPKITATGNQLMNFTEKGPQPQTDPWQARLDAVEKIQK